jgi:hypothetical protein
VSPCCMPERERSFTLWGTVVCYERMMRLSSGDGRSFRSSRRRDADSYVHVICGSDRCATYRITEAGWIATADGRAPGTPGAVAPRGCTVTSQSRPVQHSRGQ